MSDLEKKELICEAIKEYKKTEEKEKKHKVYQNTKLLMINYNILKAHSENAVYRLEDEYKELYFKGEVEETYIKSILRSKIRTTIFVNHIDIALDILKNDCIKKGTKDQFDVFYEYYINGLKIEEISEKYSCVESTIHRRKGEMLKKLGILLFGTDTLL